MIEAQTAKIIYEENANVEAQVEHIKDPKTKARVSAHLSQPRVFALYYEDGVSFYVQQKDKTIKGDKSEALDLEKQKVKKIEIGKQDGGTYKNQHELSYLRSTNLFGRRFLIKDSLATINWVLKNDVKKIGTFDCKKAIATVDGMPVEAWYTSDITIPDGPSDYYGLPGLIIELVTENKIYHAIQVDFDNFEFNFERPSKGKEITRADYIKIRDEKINELKSGNGNVLRIGG